MANRYPQAVWMPLGRQTQRVMLSHDIVCLHTMVGSLAGTDAYFKDGGYSGTESHFGVGGAGEPVRQWQDLAFSADANLDGWHRVLSIECADIGPGFPAWGGSDVPAFTDSQVDQLVELVQWLCSKAAHSRCPASWACHQHGIPTELIPDTKPGRRGIGYHRQGCDGNFGPGEGRVPGGERWSKSFGKLCPGDRRIRQIKDIIVPRVAGLTTQEDEMIDIPKLVAAFWNHRIKVTGQDRTLQAQTMLSQAHFRSEGARAAARAVGREVGELAQLVGDSTLTPAARKALADEIGARIQTALADFTAEDVVDEIGARLTEGNTP